MCGVCARMHGMCLCVRVNVCLCVSLVLACFDLH